MDHKKKLPDDLKAQIFLDDSSKTKDLSECSDLPLEWSKKIVFFLLQIRSLSMMVLNLISNNFLYKIL